MKYRYTIVDTGYSSHKYGPCTVCGKHASEVWSQTEERQYTDLSDLDPKDGDGWTHYQCRDYFGHKECLISKRRDKITEIIEKTK